MHHAACNEFAVIGKRRDPADKRPIGFQNGIRLGAVTVESCKRSCAGGRKRFRRLLIDVRMFVWCTVYGHYQAAKVGKELTVISRQPRLVDTEILAKVAPDLVIQDVSRG